MCWYASKHTDMATPPLSNYLLMYRKRTGLSQDEVALLMGSMFGSTVSRHETGDRLASFEAALAYECVLGITVAALFEGESERIRKDVLARARKLRASLRHRHWDRNRELKIRHLTQLITVRSHPSKELPTRQS